MERRRREEKARRRGVKRQRGGGRRIERVAMGWMISPCLQGYTLQLYHCRTGEWKRQSGLGGGGWVKLWKGDTDRSSRETELKKTEAPFFFSAARDLQHAGLIPALTSR